jgi:uncharacterized membrane protein
MSRRETLREAGYWTLLAGVAGTAAAVAAGLMAERVVEHDELAHQVMQRHKILAIVTLGVFTALAAWRVLRRHSRNRAERGAWATIATISVALLVVTARIGGRLSFDHAMGVPSRTLLEVLHRRGPMPVAGQADSMTDSTAGVRQHTDRPGAPPHRHQVP